MTWPRRIFFALAAPVAAVVFSLVVSALVLELSGHSAIDAFKSMWQYTDSTDSVVSTINRAIPLLRVGARSRDRVQDEPVQHRRRRPVPHGGSARCRCRCGRELHAGHPGVLHHPRRRGGRSRVGRDRRDLEGVAGRQRGALDAHAQLDRHRRACVPAHQLLASEERDRRPRHEDEAVAAVVVHPAAQPVLRVVRLPSPVQHPAQRLRRRRCPPRRRLLRAGVAHPLRLRSASDGCEPGGGSGVRHQPRRR